MKNNPIPKKIKRLLLILLPVIGLLLLSAGLFLRHKDEEPLLTSGKYDAVFLSMFPISTYHAEDFASYGGCQTILFPSVIPDDSTLQNCIRYVKSSKNRMKMIYLGIDPTKVTAEQVLDFTKMFPESIFEIFLTYHSLEDWLSMEDYEETFQAYRRFVLELADDSSRIRIFPFFAQEWLIADPENYIGDSLLDDYVALRLYLYTLDSEKDTSYHIREQETEVLFQEFHDLLDSAKKEGISRPDLSDWDVIFFGDSVIGNYSGHYSIPGYLEDFTGANTYNCAWSGSSAGGEDVSSLSKMLDNYLSGDVSSIPEGLQTRRELSRLLDDLQKGSVNRANRLYVLYYGLNDYFKGRLVKSTDPLDKNTYGGALRCAIETLHEADPDARIILSAPNFTTLWSNGSQVLGEDGGIYEEYIREAQEIAEEQGIPCLDIYHNVITPEDHKRFLSGDVHPNEFGEYLIAKTLMHCIADNLR